MNRKLTLGLVLALIAAMAISSFASAAVWTDQYIYYASDTVFISGNEMQPGETVSVDIFFPDGSPAQHNEVVADGAGDFSDTYIVPADAPAGEFTVVATGQVSGSTFSTTFDPPPARVAFTTSGLPAGVSITVTGKYTNPGGNTPTGSWQFASPGPSSPAVDTQPGSSFAYKFPDTVSAGGMTYNLMGTDPASPFSTGGSGSLTTVTATYALACTPPSVTDPVDQNITYGGDANFAASATGDSPMALQWQVSTDNGVNWTDVAESSGGKSSPLTIGAPTVTQSGTQYRAVFSNGCGKPVNSKVAELNVSKASSTTTVTGGIFLYDGNAHAATVSVIGVGGLSLTPDPVYSGQCSAAPVNVSDTPCTASYTYSGDANHTGSSGSDTLTITKAAATITVTGYDVTYDAGTHTATGTATGAKGEDLSSLLDLSGTSHEDAGTYSDSWTFAGNGNYSNASGTVTDKIAKADATIKVTPYAVVYNGDPHSATGAVTGVKGEDLSSLLNLGGTTHTDAGTYDDTWTFAGNGNYNEASGTVTDKIAKADATINVTPYDVVYNGEAHTATGTAAGVKGEDLSGLLSLGGTSHTNAGVYSDTWTFAGNGNYNNASGTVTDKIAKADAVITVTPYSAIYDANEHTATGKALGVEAVPADLSSLLDLSGTTHTNAGDYPADAWTFAGNGNYKAANGTVHDFIDKASSLTGVTCPGKVTYTGSALEPCSATVTGVGGLNQSLTVGYENNQNAGTATASASFDGDDNHFGSNGSTTFTIEKAPSYVAVTCPASVTYTGDSQTPCTAAVTGVGGLNQSLTVSYENNLNAGTAMASAAYAGDANHLSGSDSKTFTIDKADPTCTVTGYSVVFDNAAHTATGSCSGVKLETLSGLNLSGTTHILVGNYTDTWTFTDITGNYNNTSGTVNDVISAWTLSGFYQPVDMSTNLPALVYNTVKNGSTVPLKFEIFAGQTELTSTNAVKSLTYAQTSCDATATTADVDTLASGGTVLRYDATAGQFVYNWKTPNTAGKCYRVTMTTQDLSTIIAFFKLK